MGVLAVGFVISAVTTRAGIPIAITSVDLAERSRLLNLPPGITAGESEERRIEVEVLNGVGDPGLAGLFTDYLRDLGYDVVRFENAQRYDYPQSLVIGRRQDQSMAEAVALSMGVEASATDIIPDPSLQLDVTIIIGQDFKTLPSYREIMSAQANQ